MQQISVMSVNVNMTKGICIGIVTYHIMWVGRQIGRCDPNTV